MKTCEKHKYELEEDLRGTWFCARCRAEAGRLGGKAARWCGRCRYTHGGYCSPRRIRTRG